MIETLGEAGFRNYAVKYIRTAIEGRNEEIWVKDGREGEAQLDGTVSEKAGPMNVGLFRP
ncbi:hypothetical protein PAAG_03072 [Paracoccidioides lutzii Pb01]|uniref:Uncharacterized protein n=1 Tax=Paracoccidioides lutzii (strain ATCC MYA-826 / Pb01) TaxID=502779 RepID=C1GYB8_PARBA|nr:hypothetical protein PAAG_03072 [Paracoccidioides lutzii Pb01]EEH41509.2 hypothetical protein PAAG_03072 [Paracoccidioides lutzii Pb01]